MQQNERRHQNLFGQVRPRSAEHDRAAQTSVASVTSRLQVCLPVADSLGTVLGMNDFLHANTHGMPEDDMQSVTQLASTYMQGGESILEIRATGTERLQVNVGIIINKKAGSGRKLTVEKVDGNWTVTDVCGWMA